MSMKKSGSTSLEDFALYKMLQNHNCTPTVPSQKLTYSTEMIFKESVQAIEGWAHDYNNVHESIIEHITMKKIEAFAADATKIQKFFSDFITTLINGPDDADWRLLRKVYGTIMTKRTVKYLWTSRFNLLTFIDKKDFLYQPFKKIWLTVEQTTNISPKFFTKETSKTMENFLPLLNGKSQKIRNKDMVCVSDWYELLFEQYCNDNQYAVKQYQKPGINNSNQSFMRRCFDDMDFADTKKGRECTKLIEEKRAQNTKYPTDSKPLQGNVYDQKQDIRATLSTKSGKGPTPRANGETIKYTEDDKLRMASTTYARSTLAKNLPVKE